MEVMVVIGCFFMCIVAVTFLISVALFYIVATVWYGGVFLLKKESNNDD